MIEIHPRTPTLLPLAIQALATLYHPFNPATSYPKGANRDLHDFLTNEKNDECWVAIDTSTDKVVGHVSTSTRADDVSVKLWKGRDGAEEKEELSLLSRLFVLPGYRKSGVAARLVEVAVEENVAKGRRMVLAVMGGEDDPALRLYVKLGWERFGDGVVKLPDGGEEKAVCFTTVGERRP